MGLLSSLLLGCTGSCSNSSTVGASVAGTSWVVQNEHPIPGVDFGQVTIATLIQGAPEGIAVVFWSDLHKKSEDLADGASGLSYFEGRHEADGQRVDFHAQTRDGKIATVRIAGKDFDTGRGSAFLVSTQGGETRVAQITADLAGIPRDDADGMRRFAASRPEIRLIR